MVESNELLHITELHIATYVSFMGVLKYKSMLLWATHTQNLDMKEQVHYL